MKHLPVKSMKNPVRKVDGAAALRVDEASAAGPFVSFRYTRTEITGGDRGARVRSATTRLEDGRISHESFEGELSPRAYGEVVEQAQRLFASQAALALGWVGMLLPGAGRKRSADD
jgi:hypothetical protein